MNTSTTPRSPLGTPLRPFGFILNALRIASFLSQLGQFMTTLFHFFVILSAAYTTAKTLQMLSEDLHVRFEDERQALLLRIEGCHRNYEVNMCAKRPPFMVEQCDAWKLCMLRSPATINRFSLVSEYFGEAFDNVLTNVSWTSLAFLAFSFSCWIPICHNWVKSFVSHLFGSG